MDAYQSKVQLLDGVQEPKFTIKPTDLSVSNKVACKSTKPCHQQIDIMFTKEADLPHIQYLVFQNFYTAQISIKQFIGSSGSNMREEMKLEKNWVTVLHNYSLMMDPHSETDAQNWHIIGIDLFNERFKRSGLKALRIQLKQPSTNWLENTLRQVTIYTKKVDLTQVEQPSGRPATSNSTSSTDPFGSFKHKLKQSIKGKSSSVQSSEPTNLAKESPIPSSQTYLEDVRRVELSYLFNA